MSRRENIDNNFNQKKISNDNILKYNHNHMLANEEIFVTLLGIIKKQDVRITELENIINGKQSMNNFNQELPVNQIRNYSHDNHELELPCNR